MTTDAPLTRDRILAAAEDVLRRFGPAKAAVVDVARALGVTHASVYRHFASRAELRQAVVALWLDRIMPPLAAVADGEGPAPARLRRWLDVLVAAKRKRAAADPELFAAYFALATETQGVAKAHVQALVDQATRIIAAGVAAGAFAIADPAAAARAVVAATVRFHHPAHAAECAGAGVDATLNDVWDLLMNGLRTDGGSPVRAPRLSPKQRR